MRTVCLSLASVVAFTSGLRAQEAQTGAAIEAYLAPYVRTNNFAGAVLVQHKGTIVFQHAYGLADRERQQPNTTRTCFHIASLSMQFTAAAIMRLVDARALRLDDSVGALLPGTPGGDRITIRDLLTERSGLPDVNALPDYAEILQHHQTPASLVARVSGRPLLFEPGSRSLHEEHSAYNLLALVIERAAHRPFAAAVQQLVFQPLHLKDSFIDDDPLVPKGTARGYAPSGVTGLAPAPAIHWSAKAGNASACTSVSDEARWVDSLFDGHFLRESSRQAVLDTSPSTGYGWFKGTVPPFAGAMYHMSGRSPGFASFVLHLPAERLTVVVLSNIYSSATIPMGYDIARITLGLPHEQFDPVLAANDATRTPAGRFQFGPDFYQANGVLALVPSDTGLSLRWPNGNTTVLIPVRAGGFVDRSYWEPVRVMRDQGGNVTELTYGTYHGQVVPGVAP